MELRVLALLLVHAVALDHSHVVVDIQSGLSRGLAEAAVHSNSHAGYAYLQPEQCGRATRCCVKLRLAEDLEPASYSIAQSGEPCWHIIRGSDNTSLLAGLWRFIRSLRVQRRSRSVSVTDLHVMHTPAGELWPLRGHMFSCGFHPLQFHTNAEAYAYARDLSAFGTKPKP
jgi:hypothetical protein